MRSNIHSGKHGKGVALPVRLLAGTAVMIAAIVVVVRLAPAETPPLVLAAGLLLGMFASGWVINHPSSLLVALGGAALWLILSASDDAYSYDTDFTPLLLLFSMGMIGATAAGWLLRALIGLATEEQR
jgi:hypothetical protein